VRFRKQLVPAVVAIFIQACALHSSDVPVRSHVAEGCPAVLLTRTGGFGYEWQTGVVAAVWPSGTIVRAVSAERPWRTHIVGRLRMVDVAELLELVNSSTIWNQPSGEVALDMGHEVLTLRRDGEVRKWAETPGVSTTPVVAKFRSRLVALSIDQPTRVTHPLEDLWNCER
jgi:hypothetical protein